jgi:hypothetical protein
MVSVAAQAAVRAWVNGRADLVGDGMPLSRGAYLKEQRSPADGGYAVISRSSEGVTSVVAEPAPVLAVARIQCLVYAGTEEASELAAAALRTAFETLTGNPEPCGDTGVTVLAAGNHLGPLFVPHPGDTGEIYSFQVNADFVLRDDSQETR